MKFLVILICLTANYLWRQDLDRINDAWYFELKSKIDEVTLKLGEKDGDAWVFGLLAIFLVPMAALFLVLYLIDGILFGLFTMLVHIFVLMMAFDRIHPGALAKGYLDHWRNGDMEGGFLYLNKELECSQMEMPTDPAELHRTFSKLFIYRCFEKMFVMFFWYTLAGPLAVMFAYLCYQYRDVCSGNENSQQVNTVAFLIEFLEWLPVRLLGLTLSLVGDFETCFERLRKTVLSWQSDNSETLYEYAMSALGIDMPIAQEGAGKSQESDSKVSSDFASEEFRQKTALEVESLRALLERSQIVWLCIIAALTIFGLGF